MSDYGDLIGQTYGAQNPALSTTVGSIDEDPDKAQRAIDLAKATGVPPTSIYGDLDEFERQHKAILASDIVANNPHLSDFVQSDPMVPKLFNRSYGQLDELSANVSKMGLLQRLRQGLDLSSLSGTGDPLERFKGGGPIGDTGATLEDLKNHPFQSAVAAAIATPLDLFFRGIGGVFETGADEIKNIATAIGGESLGREAGAVAETEAMGLSGHHAIHLPEEPATRPHQLDEGAQVSPKVAPAQADSIKRALYYAQNQREPLPTMIPEYDEYRAKQNAEDINDLKEATRSAEALPERDANPELVRSFIAQHTPAEMGIGGDAVAAAYGDKVPTPDDNLLGWVPGIEDKLAIARATGDDVSVPIADWLAHAGADTLDVFKDDIRVRPNGITANEVKIASEQTALSEKLSVQESQSEVEPERIEGPAAQFEGNIYRGITHPIAAEEALKTVGKTLDDIDSVQGLNAEGFLTSKGRYVDRNEAYKIAVASDQIGESAQKYMKGRESLDAGDLGMAKHVKDMEDRNKPKQDVVDTKLSTAQPGPIPEPVPSFRAATALEPMLSVGDRKLTLARMKTAKLTGEDQAKAYAQSVGVDWNSISEFQRNAYREDAKNFNFQGRNTGFHDFDMLDENGRKVGAINLSEQKSGKDLYVEMVHGVGGLGPRDFGPALMRDLKRQLKTEFPNAEYLVGHRVTGMRDKFQTFAAPSAMVRVRLDALDPKSVEDFGRVLEGGKWETYSPNIQAYIKPYAEHSAADRQLIDIVNDELDRIVPKKTAIQAADTIKVKTGGLAGQRANDAIRVGGTYISYKETYPIILYALDADNVLGGARHEAVHHLRQYGFFKPEEWNTLTNEALAGGWLSKYKIDSRYPTASPNLKLEEAVAEAYQDWAGRQDKLGERAAELAQADSPLDAIFRKMKAFFDAIKERIGALLGKDPTWEDIFQKVSTGEVGGREGTAPLDVRAFNEAALSVSYDKRIKGKPDLVVARKREDGTIQIGQRGQLHPELLSESELGDPTLGDKIANMGFADKEGKFYTRQEALEYANKNEPERAAWSNQVPDYGLEGSTYYKAEPLNEKLSTIEPPKASPEIERALDEWVGGPRGAKESDYVGGIFSPRRIEDAFSGKDDELQRQILTASAPLRDSLRKEFGNSIPLYRVQGSIPEDAAKRNVVSMTSDRQFAEHYAGVGTEQKPFTEQDIAAKEAEFEKTGRAEFGKEYLIREKEGGVDYIAINNPDVGGFVTDVGSVREYMENRNAEIGEANTSRSMALQNVQQHNVPVDNVVWFTNRFGQNEFLVKTEGLDKPQALDTKLSVAEPPEGGSRVFERAAALGMTVDQFKAYDKLIQQRHVEDIAAAQKRIDNEQRRTQTKEWRDQRRQVRAEVAAQIRQRPDVAADLFFSSGELYGKKLASGYKLDTDRLTPEQRAAIPKDYQARGGLNPDDVANVFGYGSGDAMLQRLAEYNAAKKAAGMGAKDFVARVTNMEADRQMQIRHGNLEDNIVDSVKEQVASETQLDILHEETHKLGMEIGQAPLDKGAILSGIRDQFSKVQLGSFSSDRYLATAGTAGRAAELALLAKKPAKAFKEKQRQYFATALANEAIKTEKELAKFDKVAKQFSKRSLATIDQAYTNFIHDILMRVGKPVRRSIQDLETEISEGEYKSLPEFVEGKETHGLREVPVADILMDPNFRKRFDDLTVDEFNAVNTSIKTLIKNGRDEKKITKAGEEADLGEIKGQMIAQLKEFPEQKYDAKGGRSMGPLPPGLAHTIRSYGIAHIQVESLLNRWDRGDPNGVFQQYVMRDLVTAANNESATNKRYAARVAEIDDKVDLSKDVDNSIFKVPDTDQVMKLNRGNLRAVLLNLGNDSNMSKLARGYKLEPAQVMAWARQHATPEDWQWAQKMGDIFAEIKSEADEMYRHLSGVAPESIPIKPVDMGNAPALKGWYYPIIFHPQFEGASKKLMGKDALEQEGFIRATTPSGYTKARTGYAGPMALDLDMLPARMKQMLHDIAMRPAIINASKIFYDKGVRSAIFTHFGGEWRDMLTPYLVDVANSANYVPKDQRALIQASEFIRRNMISTLVGFNPGTVLKHFATAGVQSMMEVGPQNFLKALKSLTSINERTGESNWQFARRESQELQRRHQNYEETLGGTINTMMPGGKFMSFRDTVQRYAATPVAISDLVSAVPTWLAQYEKTITEGGTPGDALYMADRAVRRAHGSTAITNRSKVMRGGALSQWMASVYGFFNHVMNRQYELMWKAGETLDMVKDKEGTYQDAMKQGGQHTAMLFAYVLAPALIEEMLTPLISNDDESWGEKAAKGVAFTLGASWVGVRDIASAILNGRDPSVGLFSTAYKTISDVSRDLSKSAPFSREHAGRIIKDGATLLGALTGAPPAQVGKTAQFAYGVHAGVEHPEGPWGWMVGSRFGTLKNHSGTFQEYMRHH